MPIGGSSCVRHRVPTSAVEDLGRLHVPRASIVPAVPADHLPECLVVTSRLLLGDDADAGARVPDHGERFSRRVRRTSGIPQGENSGRELIQGAGLCRMAGCTGARQSTPPQTKQSADGLPEHSPRGRCTGWRSTLGRARPPASRGGRRRGARGRGGRRRGARRRGARGRACRSRWGRRGVARARLDGHDDSVGLAVRRHEEVCGSGGGDDRPARCGRAVSAWVLLGCCREDAGGGLDLRRRLIDQLVDASVLLEGGGQERARDGLGVGLRQGRGRWCELAVGERQRLVGAPGRVVVVLPAPVDPAETEGAGVVGRLTLEVAPNSLMNQAGPPGCWADAILGRSWKRKPMLRSNWSLQAVGS